MRIHLVVGFVEHYFAQEPRRFLSGELKGLPPKRSLSGARDLLDVRFFLASRCRVSHLMIMDPSTQSSIRESFLFQRLNCWCCSAALRVFNARFGYHLKVPSLQIAFRMPNCRRLGSILEPRRYPKSRTRKRLLRVAHVFQKWPCRIRSFEAAQRACWEVCVPITWQIDTHMNETTGGLAWTWHSFFIVQSRTYDRMRMVHVCSSKFWEARYRLYKRRFLQPNIHFQHLSRSIVAPIGWKKKCQPFSSPKKTFGEVGERSNLSTGLLCSIWSEIRRCSDRFWCNSLRINVHEIF